MFELRFFDITQPWWPYLFILIAGSLPTHIWRYLGVLSAGRLSERSPLIGVVRAVASALVAAVIARLVLYPSGTLLEIALGWRIAAVAIGFLTYLILRRSIIAGLVSSQIILQWGGMAGWPFLNLEEG